MRYFARKSTGKTMKKDGDNIKKVNSPLVLGESWVLDVQQVWGLCLGGGPGRQLYKNSLGRYPSAVYRYKNACLFETLISISFGQKMGSKSWVLDGHSVQGLGSRAFAQFKKVYRVIRYLEVQARKRSM